MSSRPEPESTFVSNADQGRKVGVALAQGWERPRQGRGRGTSWRLWLSRFRLRRPSLSRVVEEWQLPEVVTEHGTPLILVLLALVWVLAVLILR